MGVATIIAALFAQAGLANMYDVGVDLYNQRNFKGAIGQFELHLKGNPKDTRALYYTGLSFHQLGDFSRAKQFYKQAAQAGPTSQAGQMSRAWLAKLGDTEATVKSASQSSQVGRPANVTTYSQSADFASLPADARVYYSVVRGGQMNVAGYINGRPVQMVFDTGAPMITIGKTQLAELGIATPTRAADGKTGGASNAAPVDYWITRGDVKVGTIERKNVIIEVVDANASDPLLGQNFFSDFSYTIDQGAKCIHFVRRTGQQAAIASSSSYQVKDPFAVPFVWDPSGNRIIVTAEVNGKGVEMLFDTGNSASSVSFCNLDDLKKANLKLPADAREKTSVGISGSGLAYAFPVARIKLGPIDRTNVEVDVNKDGAVERPLIGQQFWSGWEYTIDMDNKLIHFKRR